MMGVAIVVIGLLMTGVVYAGNNNTALPNGAILGVSISDPVTCTNLFIPSDETTLDVDVSGSASVGQGAPDAHRAQGVPGRSVRRRRGRSGHHSSSGRRQVRDLRAVGAVAAVVQGSGHRHDGLREHRSAMG